MRRADVPGGDEAGSETACITCGGGLQGRELCRNITEAYAEWQRRFMMPHSFSYIADARTRALVIGSMPGEASLAAGEYYAHRHNLFWRFVFEAYGEPFDPKAPPAYGVKTGLLLAHGVGLWDAAESCAREGSLDSDIRDAVPNDFAALFALRPGIGRLLFNGQAAFKLFCRFNKGLLEGRSWEVLPSTSPANASIPLAVRREKWLAALRGAAAVSR